VKSKIDNIMLDIERTFNQVWDLEVPLWPSRVVDWREVDLDNNS